MRNEKNVLVYEWCTDKYDFFFPVYKCTMSTMQKLHGLNSQIGAFFHLLIIIFRRNNFLAVTIGENRSLFGFCVMEN